MNGMDITFDVNSQPVNGYLSLPFQTNAPGVLVFHAWWGLNLFFKSLCDRLAADLREGHIGQLEIFKALAMSQRK